MEQLGIFILVTLVATFAVFSAGDVYCKSIDQQTPIPGDRVKLRSEVTAEDISRMGLPPEYRTCIFAVVGGAMYGNYPFVVAPDGTAIQIPLKWLRKKYFWE